VAYGTDNGAEEVTWPDGGTMPFKGDKGTTWQGACAGQCLCAGRA